MDSSVDEILRELGVTPVAPSSSGQEQSTGSVDTDLELLLGNISSDTPAPATDSQSKAKEPPTKVFAQRSKQQAAKQPSPTKQSTSKPDEPSNLPPVFRDTSQGNEASPDSSGFHIDVDAIRAQQPPVQPIPAQEMPEDSVPQPRLRPAEKVREKQPPREFVDQQTQFSPAFSYLGGQLAKEAPSVQMDKLRSSSKFAMLIGLILLLAAVVLVAFSVILHIQRVNFNGQIPSRIALGAMTALATAAGGISWRILVGGWKSLLKFEPNRDILPAFGFSVCWLQSLGQLLFPKGLGNANIQFYIPAGVLVLSFAWLSHAMVLRTAVVNAKFVFADFRKYVPQAVSDTRLASEFTKGLVDGYGVPVINRQVDLLGDFLPISLGSDRSDTASRNLAIAALIAGGAAALFTFLFTQHKNLAVTVMTAVILVFAPLTNLFCTAYPLRRSAKILNRVSGLAAGERCMQDCAEVNAAVIDAKDLFPASSVTLSGIKTFEGMRIDEAILDAASVLVQAGSILSDVFLRIISSRTDLLRKAESMAFEDGMGLSAWVGKKRVLIGNRELMLCHGVKVPSEDYEQRFREQGCDLVYFASAGELTAVFIITLRPSQEADTAIQMLLENDILLTVHTVDAIVTKERLSELYLCETSCFKILPARLHDKFQERRDLVKLKPASLANNGSFGSMASSLVMARRVKIMVAVSGVIQMASILLGVGLVLMLTLLGAMAQFSALVVCGYLILWLAVSLLVQRLVRI